MKFEIDYRFWIPAIITLICCVILVHQINQSEYIDHDSLDMVCRQMYGENAHFVREGFFHDDFRCRDNTGLINVLDPHMFKVSINRGD